jgi:hypothetical protein
MAVNDKRNDIHNADLFASSRAMISSIDGEQAM